MKGSIIKHRGRWYWFGVLPGEERRRKIPLRMPGSGVSMRVEEKPRSAAERAARRLWDEAAERLETRAREREEKGLTVGEICDRWVARCVRYYRDADGEKTKTATMESVNIRELRETCGEKYVADMRHRDMLDVRDRLEESGIARGTVNAKLGTMKRMWRWALDEDLITAGACAELTQARPLRRGRSVARETEPVAPAREEDVEKALAKLAPNTAAMARVQRLTGMRPGEVCGMRWCDIDRSREPWVYTPRKHKTQWRGGVRAILIGPRARKILLGIEREGGTDREYVFAPWVAVAERARAMREARKTPVQPSQRDRSHPDARRRPGERWEPCAYSRAIRRACEAAGVEAWHPHQLRHNFATEVRRRFGLEATRAALGHSAGRGGVTDRYSREALAEEVYREAREAVEELG